MISDSVFRFVNQCNLLNYYLTRAIPFSVVSFNESGITFTWQEWFHCPRHLAQLSRGSPAPGRRFCSSCCLRGGRVRFESKSIVLENMTRGRLRFEFKSILLENVKQGCEWECERESERKRWQMEKQRDSSWECENVQEPTFSLLQTLGMNALALFVLALLQILSKDHFINQTMFHICVRTDYEWKPCLLSKLFFQGRRSDKFWTDCHTLSFEGHILEVNTSCFITDITNRMCEINLSTCTRAKYNDHPQSTTSQTAFV